MFALTMARTKTARQVPGATAALLIASNAPDLDIITAFTGGTGAYLAAHRGATHGPLGILGLAAVVGTLVWMFVRPRHGNSRPPARPGPLVAISLFGVLMHVLMDVPTVYGTHLLSPFSDRWFSYDWLPIIDLHLWVALGVGLVAGTIMPKARPRILTAVLLVMVGNYVLRAVAHDRAMTIAGHPAPLLRLSSWPGMPDGKLRPCDGHQKAFSASSCHAIAIPSFLSPFQWRIIAAHDDRYEISDVHLFDPAGAQARGRLPVDQTEWTKRAAEGPIAQIFLGFSRVSSAHVRQRPQGGVAVVFRDLRFVRGAIDEYTARTGGFTATSILDEAGRILEERLVD
jgi:membrane-bound metal-dependent hydrolase YbcI (DUF457 family)